MATDAINEKRVLEVYHRPVVRCPPLNSCLRIVSPAPPALAWTCSAVVPPCGPGMGSTSGPGEAQTSGSDVVLVAPAAAAAAAAAAAFAAVAAAVR